MLINPIHAGAPVPPLQPSPYLPESRRFLNVTYIRPQDIPEYAALDDATRAQVEALHASVAAANDSAEPMDINASWTPNGRRCGLIFSAPRSEERRDRLRRVQARGGAGPGRLRHLVPGV